MQTLQTAGLIYSLHLKKGKGEFFLNISQINSDAQTLKKN